MRVAFVAIFLLVALIYSHSLPAIWTIDDGPNILENPQVQIRDLSAAALYRSMFSPLHPNADGTPGFNRPLAHLSFALNWYFGQDFADRVSRGEHRHPLPDGLHSFSGGADAAPIAQHGRAFSGRCGPRRLAERRSLGGQPDSDPGGGLHRPAHGVAGLPVLSAGHVVLPSGPDVDGQAGDRVRASGLRLLCRRAGLEGERRPLAGRHCPDGVHVLPGSVAGARAPPALAGGNRCRRAGAPGGCVRVHRRLAARGSQLRQPSLHPGGTPAHGTADRPVLPEPDLLAGPGSAFPGPRRGMVPRVARPVDHAACQCWESPGWSCSACPRCGSARC